MSDFGNEFVQAVMTRASHLQERATNNRVFATNQFHSVIMVLKNADSALNFVRQRHDGEFGSINVSEWTSDKITGEATCTAFLRDPALGRSHQLTLTYNNGKLTIDGLDEKAAEAIHTPDGRIRIQTPRLLPVTSDDWVRLPRVLEGFLMRYFGSID